MCLGAVIHHSLILSLWLSNRVKTMFYYPIYKILTKVLATRMKKVLPSVIHHNQTGFVEGRRIVDSIRIIQDIMSYAKQNKLGGMLLFIDFEKAFDSINWTFMLQGYNF